MSGCSTSTGKGRGEGVAGMLNLHSIHMDCWTHCLIIWFACLKGCQIFLCFSLFFLIGMESCTCYSNWLEFKVKAASERHFGPVGSILTLLVPQQMII